MKTITINRYYDKKGNSYATRDEQQCLDIIYKKLKIDTNPKTYDDNYFKKVSLIMSIRKQVKEQYDCNKRKNVFKISIN